MGELCECFQWKGDVPNGLTGWSDADRLHLGQELSDVLLYLLRLADKAQIDLVYRYIPTSEPFMNSSVEQAMLQIQMRPFLRYPDSIDLTAKVLKELDLG